MEVLEDQQDISRDRGQSHREPKKHPKLVKRLTAVCPYYTARYILSSSFFAVSV